MRDAGWPHIGRATTVPLRSGLGTRTVPVSAPERIGMPLVDVSEDMSASVLFEVDGVSEIGTVVEGVIEVDS